MQGYILQINRARDEDLVVSIITQQNLDTLYRFYGARHGMINLGFKIDFESESSLKSSIGRLRDVIHLGFPWITDYNRLRLWQQFIALFYPHLNQSENTGSFYFDLLDHEGRLHSELTCFFCDQPIENDISLIRAFLPSHPNCSHTLSINQEGLEELFRNHSSLFLSDKEIDRLWYVLLEGL